IARLYASCLQSGCRCADRVVEGGERGVAPPWRDQCDVVRTFMRQVVKDYIRLAEGSDSSHVTFSISSIRHGGMRTLNTSARVVTSRGPVEKRGTPVTPTHSQGGKNKQSLPTGADTSQLYQSGSSPLLCAVISGGDRTFIGCPPRPVASGDPNTKVRYAGGPTDAIGEASSARACRSDGQCWVL